MVSLSKFYSNKSNMAAILPYINGNGAISLRMIDWFVTNYVRTHNVILPQAGGRFINVYVSYRVQLKAYSKQQFDPFRRRDRIMFHYEPGEKVETTVGQLNFFRWLLQNRILSYIQENSASIETAMMTQDSMSMNKDKAIEAEEGTDALVLGKSSTAPSSTAQLPANTWTRCANVLSVHGQHKITFE